MTAGLNKCTNNLNEKGISIFSILSIYRKGAIMSSQVIFWVQLPLVGMGGRRAGEERRGVIVQKIRLFKSLLFRFLLYKRSLASEVLRLKCFLLFSNGSTSIKPTRAGEEKEEPSTSSAMLPPTEAADSRPSPPRDVILGPLEEGEDKEDIFCPSRYVRGVAMEEETASRALLKLVSVVTIRLPTKLITPS